MDKKLNKKFNNQINQEYHAAYIYLGMSEWLQANGYPGFSHWMLEQVKEEVSHAEGLMEWVQRHDGTVELPEIEAASTEYDSLMHVFEEALKHEQLITKNIDELAIAAKEAKDLASERFLDWYIMEQVEEEEAQRENIDNIKLAGAKQGSGLFNLDREMAKRVFTPPVIPYLD